MKPYKARVGDVFTSPSGIAVAKVLAVNRSFVFWTLKNREGEWKDQAERGN